MRGPVIYLILMIGAALALLMLADEVDGPIWKMACAFSIALALVAGTVIASRM